MIFIKHRVNTLPELEKITDLDWGCEIDIRSDIQRPSSLVVTHDPWTKGCELSEWLALFAKKRLKGPLILNTKEDGLEERCMALAQQRQLSNYFFLDTSLPTLVKWTGKGIKNFAVRLSRFEPDNAALIFANRVNWVWVDCFDRAPVNVSPDFASRMSAKLCLVSPELQGGDEKDMPGFTELARQCAAVCTKTPLGWTKYLG